MNMRDPGHDMKNCKTQAQHTYIIKDKRDLLFIVLCIYVSPILSLLQHVTILSKFSALVAFSFYYKRFQMQ